MCFCHLLLGGLAKGLLLELKDGGIHISINKIEKCSKSKIKSGKEPHRLVLWLSSSGIWLLRVAQPNLTCNGFRNQCRFVFWGLSLSWSFMTVHKKMSKLSSYTEFFLDLDSAFCFTSLMKKHSGALQRSLTTFISSQQGIIRIQRLCLQLIFLPFL